VGDRTIDGWALNTSRGGLRAIVDEAIELGAEVKVAVSDGPPRPCRIVWIQEEPDGAIVGAEYLDVPGSMPNFEALSDIEHASGEPSGSDKR
jgi:hypothetical protein